MTEIKSPNLLEMQRAFKDYVSGKITKDEFHAICGKPVLPL